MFEINRYSADEKCAWNGFIDLSKNGTFLFNRNYMDYHADRFHDFSLMFYCKGKLFAVLPANIRNGVLYSHQGLTYGGLVTNRSARAANICSLFKELNGYLKENGVRKVVYKALPWIYSKYMAEEDLYDSEDFVGYELEYTADYFRIGENTYTDPEYGLFFEDIFTVNDGGRFLPHVCDFMEEEGIDWHDDKYYGQRDGMELHLLVYIDFEETVFYETYDFIPVGTRFTLLNEDTMLVEFWGKTLLARRVA